MQTWLDVCERVLTVAASVATFGMMLLTTADAGGRYLLNRPLLAAYEVTTSYLMVAAVFLAMPYAYRQGANIRVTFLVSRLGRTARLVVDHLVQVISMLYCVGLLVATFLQAQNIVDTKTRLTTVDLPLWPGHAAVVVGLLVLSLMLLLDLGQVRRGRSPLFRDG